MSVNKPRYGRILLKLSGEALMGDKSFGIDPTILKTVAKEVHDVSKDGVEVAIVIGGGNIFRGIQLENLGLERSPADQMGMLAYLMVLSR